MAAKKLKYVILTLKFERQGNQWVGTCVELSTSTFARTLRQTQKELRELVIAHLNVLEQEGERERFFKEWGIEAHAAKPAPPEIRIRGLAAEWDRLLEDSSAPQGPFFQPGVFSVGPETAQRPALAGT